MSGFAALMALSASQTRQSDQVTQTLLAERQRKEEAKRKEQEAKERKEKEIQARERQKLFEEEQREKERQRKAAEERERREQLLQKREEEQRRALLYGKQKAKGESKAPREGGGGGGAFGRKSREGSADSLESGAMALTREEKRQRKLQAELNRGFSAPRRSVTPGHSRPGRKLAGGAVDVLTKPDALNQANSTGQSVKQRLAAMPNTLTKLNVVKRDTRTIDEIIQDRARMKESKVIDGDAAKDFHDWFSSPKKNHNLPVKKPLSLQPSPRPSPSPSRPLTPNPAPPSSSAPQPQTKKTSSAPVARTKSAEPTTSSSGPPTPSEPAPKPRKVVINKITPSEVTSLSLKPNYNKTSMVSSTHINSSTTTVKNGYKDSHSASRTSTEMNGHSSTRKRPRSPSLSPPPVSSKRRSISSSNSSSSARNDISSEIWKLFGKNRDQYVRNDDIYSDEDDDMEADASEVLKEELRSSRIARREDDEAFEEERRHEEEKRRKRKEKFSRERRM